MNKNNDFDIENDLVDDDYDYGYVKLGKPSRRNRDDDNDYDRFERKQRLAAKRRFRRE